MQKTDNQMMKQIFINLPVENIEKSSIFFTNIGFKIYPLFTFDDQKCLAWGEHILLMLHSKEFKSSENKKTLINKREYLIPTYTLPVENLEKLNQIVENCFNEIGIEPTSIRDEGFMQIRTFEDFDGYIWDLIYLDEFKKLKN